MLFFFYYLYLVIKEFSVLNPTVIHCIKNRIRHAKERVVNFQISFLFLVEIFEFVPLGIFLKALLVVS